MVVEVTSRAPDTARGARIVKRDAYAAAGVPAHLLIDRDSHSVVVHGAPPQGAFRRPAPSRHCAARSEDMRLPPVHTEDSARRKEVKGIVSIAFAEHQGPWTVDDVLGLPEDTHSRIELVGGSLMMSPAPGLGHQRASQRLYVALSRAAEANGAPVEVFETINVVVPDGLLIPDLAVVDIEVAESGGVTVNGSDVLAVVEIASPSTRITDRRLKPALYAAAGIAHYWRVELEPAPRIHAAALAGGAFRTPTVAHAGAEHTLDMGFPVPLDPASLTIRRR
jgi:Uma2 family endonuclease